MLNLGRGLVGAFGGKRRVDQKQENYLSKAKEAEEMAQKAKNVLTRVAWQKIAENYRVLAGSKAKH